MAKITSIIKFNGTLDGLSGYELEGVEGTVVRRKGGPTREQVQTAAEFANTRKNNKETAGRSRATGAILAALGGLRPMADQSCAGRLNALLKPVQEGDGESEWGKRHVRLSQMPGLLEGFRLRKVYPLENFLPNPLNSSIDKATGAAIVDVPALLPGINFFSPKDFPLCRVVAALGVVPDLFYSKAYDHYFPDPQFTGVNAQTTYGDWFPVLDGAPAAMLTVQLPQLAIAGSFSLLLTVGLQWGTVAAGGTVKWVKKVKSARIERVV